MTAASLSLPVANAARPSARSRLLRPRATLLVALGLGLGAEVLFDDQELGVSVPIFTVLLLGALLGLGGREGWQRARPNAWLLVPWLYFAGMVFVRASPVLVGLNLLAVVGLGLLVVHVWAAGRVERLGLWDYPRAMLGSLGQALVLAPEVLRAEVDWRPSRRGLGRLLPVLRGALLAVPVLALFGELLASADQVFEAAVARGLDGAAALLSWTSLGRVVFVGVSALGVLGLLAHAQRRRRAREAGEAEVAEVPARLGFTECLTLVVLVDLLFLGFASIQLAFLSGAARLPEGFTYAGYARRGFFELLAVSVLTLGLSLALTRWTRLDGPWQRAAFRSACTVMVGLVLVLLVAAMKRMALYEDAYGYTRLRVYTQVFMGALAGVLVWRAVTLWWRPERFALGAFVGALAWLGVLDGLDPDAFIARESLARFDQGLSWDDEYLDALSEDAVPVLAARLSARTGWGEPHHLEWVLCRQSSPPPEGWASFHLARHRAAKLLAGLHCDRP